MIFVRERLSEKMARYNGMLHKKWIKREEGVFGQGNPRVMRRCVSGEKLR
jgi:hypothetical protein